MGVVIDASTEAGQRELIQFSAQVKGLQELRKPFPPERIEKLPKPLYKNAWDGESKSKCDECGGYHVRANTIHLDYVGHANCTDRLLEIDPWWNWEPMAYTPEGLPLFSNGGMWIKLTICGVTRIGFGDGSSIKEVIGDAIRNAAMRFGVALDLWAKVDLHEAINPPAPAPKQSAQRGVGRQDRAVRDGQSQAQAAAPRRANQDALDALQSVCDKHGYATQYCIDRFWSDYDIELKDAAAELILVFADTLIAEATAEPGEGDAALGEGDGAGSGAGQAGAAEGQGADGDADVGEPVPAAAAEAKDGDDTPAESDGAGDADGGIKF